MALLLLHVGLLRAIRGAAVRRHPPRFGCGPNRVEVETDEDPRRRRRLA